MTKRIYAAALVALGLALAVTPMPARAVEAIPFTTTSTGQIQVQASVDGQPPVPMLVDLGAGIDVLSGSLGRRTVIVDSKYTTLRLSGQRVDLPIGTIVSLSIAGIPIDVPRIGIWDGLDATGVDGLIAATSFRSIATTFDWRNKQLILEDAASFADRKRTATRVPLILEDDLGISLGVFAQFNFGNGLSGLCEIDTRSQGITLDTRFAKKLGVDLSHGKTGTISSFGLDQAPMTTLTNPTVAFADLINDCDVGNSFWNDRLFTLDISNRALWISTN